MSRRPVQVTKEVHAQIKAIATSKGINMSEAISFLIEEYRNKNGEQSMYKQEEFFNGSIVRVKDNGFVSLEDNGSVKGKNVYRLDQQRRFWRYKGSYWWNGRR